MADYMKELQRAHEQTKKQQEDLKKKVDEKPTTGSQPADKERAPKEANNTDDAYKGAPRGRDMAWRNNNGQRNSFGHPRGAGERGRGRGGRGMRGRGRDGEQGGEYQRGGRRGYFRGNTDGEGADGVNEFENGAESYGYRGGFRGRGAFRGGPRGGRGRGEPGFRGRGGPRGGRRGGQYNEYYNEVEYQSAEEQEPESEEEMLTNEQFEFIESKVEQNIDKLKGIVDAGAIERKCRELEFDDKLFQEWVNSLIVVDQRALADLEWNQTVTKEQKHMERVSTLHKAKLKAIKDSQRKERQELMRVQKEKRDADRAVREEARLAKLKEKEERKADRDAKKGSKGEDDGSEDQELEDDAEVDQNAIEENGATAEGQDQKDNEGADTGVAPKTDKLSKDKKKNKSKEKTPKGGQKTVYQRKEGGQTGSKTTMQYQAKAKPAGKAAVTPGGQEQYDGAKNEAADYYDEEEEGMNIQVDDDKAQEDNAEDGVYVSKQSEDDDTELLAQTTQQHQKDEEERKRKQQEQEDNERVRLAQQETERRKRDLEAQKKKNEAEAAKKVTMERKRKQEEEDRIKKEKDEVDKKKKEKEQEEKRLAEQKKQQEEAQTNAQQANSSGQNSQANPLMFNPMLTAGGMGQNPMMMGMAPGALNFDKDADPAQLESQKQYLQQMMHFHQQCMLQFQAAYMQVAMQQQLLQTGNQQSSSSKNSTQFSGQKPPVDMPMMGPNNPAMMGMIPGGMPGMGGAQGMGGAGLGQDQQQFMQFQPFMPMMYPGGGGGMNFPGNFANKNDEK